LLLLFEVDVHFVMLQNPQNQYFTNALI